MPLYELAHSEQTGYKIALIIGTVKQTTMDFPKSSAVSSVNWSDLSNEVTIAFRNAKDDTTRSYTYKTANLDQFTAQLREVESVGRFVNKCFKDEKLTRIEA